jgi:uncharacterized protein (DUF2062 family)
MIERLPPTLRRWLEKLLHVEDTPTRTAAAYAVGVFFGFSPILGLHTVAALIVAFILNLNRVAVIAGVYSNLPWIIAPFYATATMFGALLMRTTLPTGFRGRLAEAFSLSIFQREFWTGLWTVMAPLFWPFMFGSTILALALALLAYRVANAFLSRFSRHQAKARKPA